jgi:2-amino-4-hydroxy-6-hydroxymethyldihydropteridine diphosphokinase
MHGENKQTAGKRDEKNIAVIGIGSNIDADSNIARILEMLEKEMEILKISAFVKTKPIGIENQPDFTNGAVKICTGLNRLALNRLLTHIAV